MKQQVQLAWQPTVLLTHLLRGGAALQAQQAVVIDSWLGGEAPAARRRAPRRRPLRRQPLLVLATLGGGGLQARHRQGQGASGQADGVSSGCA
jgi:hypothetical protein